MPALLIDESLYEMREGRVVKSPCFAGRPLAFCREGRIDCQAPPPLSLFYRLLWRRNKLQGGYFRHRDRVYRVEPHNWWGLVLFNYVKKEVGDRSLLLLKEAPHVLSVMVVKEGLLTHYARVKSFSQVLRELLEEGLEVRFFGLGQAEIPDIKGEVKMLYLANPHSYQFLEEMVAHPLLSQKTRSFPLWPLLSPLGANVGSWLFHYRRLVQEERVLEERWANLKKHPLYGKGVPIEWNRLLPPLIKCCAELEVRGNRIKVKGRVRDALKKAGFHLLEPKVLTLSEEEEVEARY